MDFKSRKFKIMIPVLIILVAIFIYFYVNYETVTICDSEECFISAANDCENATLAELDGAALLSFASQDCVLTKTLLAMDPNEPESIRNLLEGKSLACEYAPGKFDEGWVKSLYSGLDSCSGELKDSLNLIPVFN